MKKYNYEWALERFNETLASVKNGLATDVYEARSLPLNNVKNMKKTLNTVPKGSAVWQHTSKWHVAMIYIQKGQGQRFNRSLLDLIASGVNTPAKFKQAWLKKNGGNMGTFPTVKVSKTSEIRHAQASYIVADFNKRPNPNSQIPKMDGAKTTHRTHLISAQTTGIENHKGLLIEYDGWLNMYPMNQFEQEMLDLSKTQDIIWIAQVYQASDGLHLRYLIYNARWKLLHQKEWVDDRWTYVWYFDPEQDVFH